MLSVWRSRAASALHRITSKSDDLAREAISWYAVLGCRPLLVKGQGVARLSAPARYASADTGGRRNSAIGQWHWEAITMPPILVRLQYQVNLFIQSF
jgi:hypothetical protein